MSIFVKIVLTDFHFCCTSTSVKLQFTSMQRFIANACLCQKLSSDSLQILCRTHFIWNVQIPEKLVDRILISFLESLRQASITLYAKFHANRVDGWDVTERFVVTFRHFEALWGQKLWISQKRVDRIWNFWALWARESLFYLLDWFWERYLFFRWSFDEVSEMSIFGVIFNDFKNFKTRFSMSSRRHFFFPIADLKSASNFQFSSVKTTFLVKYNFGLTYRRINLFWPQFSVKWLWRMMKAEIVV